MKAEPLYHNLYKLSSWVTSWLETKAFSDRETQRYPSDEYESSRSPESPVKTKEEDLLGRWRFAKNIYQLAKSAPRDWSLRIGVFGDWGEGKTSVLEFINRMAKSDGNIVAWFNPWEPEERENLWTDFATSVYAAIEKAGITIPGTLKRRIRAIAWSLKRPLQEAAKLDTSVGAVAGALSSSSPIGRWIVPGQGELVGIPKLIGQKRLIIMIDDLDRANPAIVPHLLLALRELLNIPSFVFILAFSPNIVAEALKKGHPGWGTGFQFLDKIIDFQYRIPTATKEQLWSLAEHEVDSHCDFVDRTAFEMVFDLIPKSPRKLKQFVRNLWCLKPEIERHHGKELNWNAILLCQLLNIEFPALFDSVFKQRKMLKDISDFGFSHVILDKKEKKKQEFESNLNELLDVREIEQESDKKRAREIIMALSERSSMLDEKGLLYQAMLGEQPHALTWKEFDSFLAAWKAQKTVAIAKDWLKNHGREREEDWSRLFQDAFRTTIIHRGLLLEEAADSDRHEDLVSKVREAGDDLTLIKQFCFDLGGLTGEEPLLGINEFMELLDMVHKWIHFTNDPHYRVMRKEERLFLIECVERTPRIASDLMELLHPWFDISGPFNEERVRREFDCELATVAQEHVADDVVDRFSKLGGIVDLWGTDKRLPEKFVLFRANGPIWDDKRRETLLELSTKAKVDSAIYENFFEFIRMLIYAVNEKGLGFIRHEEIMELAKDKEIVGAAWKAVISVRIQPRMLGSFRGYQALFAKIADSDEHLPLPDWWTES